MVLKSRELLITDQSLGQSCDIEYYRQKIYFPFFIYYSFADSTATKYTPPLDHLAKHLVVDFAEI